MSTYANKFKTVEERVKVIVAEQLGARIEDVKGTSAFVSDLGADSLDVVELAMTIEDEFVFEAPDEEIEKLTTVQQVIDYVTAKTAA